MKKQIVIALAFMIGAFSFAQKKELKAVEKAIKGNNFAQAKSLLTQVESLLGAADEKTKGKYYFLKGKALYANGAGNNADFESAIENFDKAGSNYSTQINEVKASMLQNILTKANTALENKDYASSSKGFEHAYKLSPKDTMYLYFAASTAVNGQDFDNALGMYKELKDLGYTGIAQEFYAYNKELEKEELFGSKQLRDISVKAGTHIKPEDRITKSKRSEIVKNIALIYISQDKNEMAIEAMKDARAENPEDLNLLLAEANVHYKMGHMDTFKELMKEATEMNPTDPELQFNLGVLSYESGDKESAKMYYQKAIDLDPNYINAQINMAALILDGEQAIVDEMNNLGTSAADDRKYDELKEKRQQVYKDAIPYLTSALETDPKNLQAAKTLMNIYSAVGDTDNYKATKERVDAIESGN
ncbi:MAG: tetratricopeptide repeat protein [Flavobacteriaceae bacterium]|nr:tetratricopeptide repeat protein [Flavobacteriaceae bacterium]